LLLRRYDDIRADKMPRDIIDDADDD